MSQSRSTVQSVYVYLLEVRLLYPLFILYKKYHKKLFLLIFFCFLFVANLKLDSVEFQQKLDFVFPPRVQLQNSRRQGASLLIFFVIYKLFKIYITISLQYNYCLVWLSCSSSSKSILSLSHFQFTVSQIMATFFFLLVLGYELYGNDFLFASKHL